MPDPQEGSRLRPGLILFGALGLLIALLALLPAEPVPADLRSLALSLPRWTIAPFVLLLACIAIAPLATPRAWERNGVKAAVSLLVSVPICVWLAASWGSAGLAQIADRAREYVSFMCLLTSLFVISGGIFVRGSLSGTPLMNTAFLGVGALLANLFGTTGASMVLIRPLLRANASRETKSHVVIFFIFVVSNCGGLLTPLGDPPLFLGFLKGVPFEWPLLHLFLPWLFVNGLLLVLFHFWDQAVFDAEERRRPGSQLEEVMRHEPLRVEGLLNLGLLLLVVAVIFASGRGLFTSGASWPFGAQEAAMLGLGAVSLFATPARLHRENDFSWGPIVEVAVLFAGLFATMGPALLLLNAHGSQLGMTRPWQFFWATGALSSFLDNAPTYLTFAATAAGTQGIPAEGRFLGQVLAQGGAPLLAAISAGAVMMGAMTYVGNGPNFMVKAVAERAGIKMPSFFGYLVYSCGFLLPLFLAATLLFFRG